MNISPVNSSRTVFLFLIVMLVFGITLHGEEKSDTLKASAYFDKAVSLPYAQLDSSISLMLEFLNSKKDVEVVDSFRALDLLSTLYLDKGQLDSALSCAYTGLELAKKNGMDSLIAASYNTLESIHFEMRNFELSEYYALEMLEFSREKDLGTFESQAYWALAMNYSRKYADTTLDGSEKERLYQKSKEYYSKALSGEGIDQVDSIDIYSTMSLLEADHGNYEIAIEHMKKVADYYEENRNLVSLSNIYNNLGYTYFEIGQFELAEKYLVQAWSLVQNTPLFIERNYISESLYEFYEDRANYKKALYFYKQHEAANNQLDFEQIRKNLDIKESEYQNRILLAENAKNEQQLQNQFLIMIIGLILLLSLIIILVILYFAKKKQDDLLLQVRKSNSQLEELNQFKDQILSVISHDFKSPLNNLQIAIELAREEDLTSDEYKTILSGIDDQLSRTQIFLQNILFWARNQIKGYTVEKRTFNFHELVQESIDLLQEQLKHKNIHLLFHYDKNESLYTDREIINITFRNILQNAVKYSRENENIAIKMSEMNDHKVISVIDSGIGMDKDVIDQLFTYNLESTGGTQLEKGSGIGLLLSRDLLQLIGGEIKVFSVKNQGSDFQIILPKV